MTDQTSEILRRVDEIEDLFRNPILHLTRDNLQANVLWLSSQLRTALKDTERLDKAQATRYELLDISFEGPILTGYAWGIHGQWEDIRTAIDTMDPKEGNPQ